MSEKTVVGSTVRYIMKVNGTMIKSNRDLKRGEKSYWGDELDENI